MKIFTSNGCQYHIPSNLNAFQTEMYVHLINWKWKHITKSPGYDCGNAYDAILPDRYIDTLATIYPSAVDIVKNSTFRIHKYFNHMASSQAANINLFLPILINSRSHDVLNAINPQFARLATGYLDNGWQLEFWNGNSNDNKGLLGDHNAHSGTDADIAIAYYNKQNELCLWLIEHKLTESEFTTCGGFRSNGRKECHDCTRSFADILANKNICYYYNVCKYNYWDITEKHKDLFVNHIKHEQCPFQGGMNQLWRNQLLALAIEDQQSPYKHVSFSVVKHPGNTFLDKTLKDYSALTNNNHKFSVFTSEDMLIAAEKCLDPELDDWSKWYRDLYKL